MEYECDEVPDCADNSDEINCDIVKIDSRSYRKEYPPIRIDFEKTKVNVSMKIMAINNIHDIQETFQAKFSISLEWYDNRPTYYYLHKSNMSNLIGNEERNRLWIPPIIFNNTDSNHMVTNDNPSALLFVERRGKRALIDLADINEGYSYKGSENPLVYTADYDLVNHCVFNLHHYPFDTQTCSIQVNTAHILSH